MRRSPSQTAPPKSERAPIRGLPAFHASPLAGSAGLTGCAGYLFGNEGRAAMSVEKLVEHFAAIEDPRCAGKVEHRLIDILVIAVCAVIACAESWDDIALYGRSKLTWLQSFLSLAHGIPSHDTFRRVFMLIDPDAFETCFSAWAQSFAQAFDREVVAIDGKTLRRKPATTAPFRGGGARVGILAKIT